MLPHYCIEPNFYLLTVCIIYMPLWNQVYQSPDHVELTSHMTYTKWPGYPPKPWQRPFAANLGSSLMRRGTTKMFGMRWTVVRRSRKEGAAASDAKETGGTLAVCWCWSEISHNSRLDCRISLLEQVITPSPLSPRA